MRGVSRWIISHRKTVVIIYIVAMIVSVAAMRQVKTNYVLTDYLPDDASSTVGLRLMDEEFDSKPSNLRIMLPESAIPEILEIKERLSSIKGVKDVTWLDDSVDVTQPLEMIDKSILDSWYKDKKALITAYISDDASKSVISEIRSVVGEDAAIAGDKAQAEETRKRVSTDIAKMLAIAIPIIYVILFFTTTSAVIPALFLISIGVAILLGKGTDLIFGEISFVTSACSAILQLATSMDYAIFLVESFEDYRSKGLGVEDAMVEAMARAFSSIFSSSLTTVFGFLALTLMRFKIGYDLGMVLAKGIVFSLLSIMTLLPVLTIMCNGLIEKTQHKKWVSSFNGFGRLCSRICIPLTIVLGGIIVLPSILAYLGNDYIYGTTQMITDPAIRVVQDQNAIDDLYEKSNQMVLMVPYGQPATEQALINDLQDIDGVTSITAYATMADTTIPVDFVGKNNLKQLIGDRYSRMIISANTDLESAAAFKLVEDIRADAEIYYPGDNFLTGGTSNIYDMRDVVISDDTIVNELSVGAIGLVLVLTFKSLTIPIVLLAVIKSSIYINLAVPYFTGEPLYYLSLLIINSVQLGATVDYGILLTDKYMEKRKKAKRLEAMAQTVAEAAPSILTSSSILFTGGTMLGSMSSVGIIKQLGFLVGRGALISAGMVILSLPALIIIFDPLIRVTTINAKFLRPSKYEWKVSSDEEKELDEAYNDYVGAVGDDDGVRAEERGNLRESVKRRRGQRRIRG